MIVIKELFELKDLPTLVTCEVRSQLLQFLEHLVLRVIVKHDLVHILIHIKAWVNLTAIEE